VGTDTLICGTTGVEVKIGVEVSVWVAVSVNVGVKVGGSGVYVNVGSGWVGESVADNAAWTKPAITVSAAAVLIAPESCSVMAGIAQDRITTDSVMIVRETRLE